MSAETNRLSHMVENVLSFSRLEKTTPKSHNEVFALKQIISRVEKNLMMRCYEDEMKLKIQIDEDLLNTPLIGNPAAIEHILFNLVDNACKYASESENKEIVLKSHAENKWLHMSLHDFGPGIQFPEKLFKPFSKSVNEAAQSKPGIGLGLALCKQLALDMGGDLVYKTTPIPGAHFTLLLKISK